MSVLKKVSNSSPEYSYYDQKDYKLCNFWQGKTTAKFLPLAQATSLSWNKHTKYPAGYFFSFNPLSKRERYFPAFHVTCTARVFAKNILLFNLPTIKFFRVSPLTILQNMHVVSSSQSPARNTCTAWQLSLSALFKEITLTFETCNLFNSPNNFTSRKQLSSPFSRICFLMVTQNEP